MKEFSDFMDYFLKTVLEKEIDSHHDELASEVFSMEINKSEIIVYFHKKTYSVHNNANINIFDCKNLISKILKKDLYEVNFMSSKSNLKCICFSGNGELLWQQKSNEINKIIDFVAFYKLLHF